MKKTSFLGYDHRFKRRLHMNHPNVWAFIDSIEKEVEIVHGIIAQIISGMQPHTKRLKNTLTEQRIKELYDRFYSKNVSIHEFLRGLSFYVVHKK